MEEQEKDIKLTDAEKEFCELFVNGDKEFAGQATACYREVFGENKKNLSLAARRLLAKSHIASCISELLEERKIDGRNRQERVYRQVRGCPFACAAQGGFGQCGKGVDGTLSYQTFPRR